MKKLITLLLCLCLCAGAACAEPVPGDAGEENAVGFRDLLNALAAAARDPDGEAPAAIDAVLAELDDPLAQPVADQWRATWMNPDYRLYMYGRDDPAQLPVRGRHAFVVLGYALEAGGVMSLELAGRCKAAAEAAKAFPDSIIVCTGGATGYNNTEGYTEAGVMKDYLVERCGIRAGRIFTDELSRSTVSNAVNSLEILKEHRIETMTIVTSDYHQLWAQTLFAIQAEKIRQKEGRSVEIIGNFNWPADKDDTEWRNSLSITVSQAYELLRRP